MKGSTALTRTKRGSPDWVGAVVNGGVAQRSERPLQNEGTGTGSNPVISTGAVRPAKELNGQKIITSRTHTNRY